MDAVRDPGGSGTHDRSGTQVVTRQTLADSVYERLRTAITRGDLPGGTELKQVQLAAQFGVSRVPVREALRRLQAEQLIVGNPFQCFYVTRLTPAQVMELLDIRELLEVFVLTRSQHSPDLSQRIEDAQRAAERVAAEPQLEQFLEADRDFHRILNGNTPGAALIDDGRERVHRYIYSAWTTETSELLQNQRRAEILREHQALLDAMVSFDTQEIRDVVEQHVNGTRLLIRTGFIEASQQWGEDQVAADGNA